MQGAGWLCLFVVLFSTHDIQGSAHAHKGLNVNYTSLSQRDAERHGQGQSRLIVVARYQEDTSWLDELSTEHIVMQLDPEYMRSENATGHPTLSSKGREAMAYLQFLIDFYYYLPDSIAFVHGHRSAWHMYDVVPVLQRLRWGEIGFANLRYSPFSDQEWACGSGDQVPCDWAGGTIHAGELEFYLDADTDPLDPNGLLKQCAIDMAEMWDAVMAAELGPLPTRLSAPCCGNFIVSRDRILKHSRHFYQELRGWLLTTTIDDYRTSIVLEYLWAYMFGEPAEIKPLEKCLLLVCDKQ